MSWGLRWSKKAARQTQGLGNYLWLPLMDEVHRCCRNPYRASTHWLNASGTRRALDVGHLEVRFELRVRSRELVVTSVEEVRSEQRGVPLLMARRFGQ